MTKRWKQRPDGSTWGDWGDDDELGRINLLTPEKVLAGRAGGRGRHQLLPEPAARLPGRHRVEPAAATRRCSRRPRTSTATPHLLQRPQEDIPKYGGPRHVDVWADDVVTLSLQYSTQWDSLAHAGAEFDADGDGVEEAVFYNGYRAESTSSARSPTPRATAADHRASRTISASSTWRPRRAGPRCAHRRRAPPRSRVPRCRPRDARRDHGGRQRRRRARRHAADPHGFATEGPRVEPRPDPRGDPPDVHVPRRARRRRCSNGSPTRRSPRSSPTTTRSRAWSAGPRPEGRHSLLPIHHLCLFKLGVPLGELWYLHELAPGCASTTAAASSSPRHRCACRARSVRR